VAYFYLTTVIIGLLAGFFSGQFGVGGAFLMQPALRLLLNTPKLVTIGTPIPVIVVSSLTGVFNYYRSGYVDTKIAGYLAISGMAGSVFGSLATGYVNGSILLIATAIVLAVTSVRFIIAGRRRDNEVTIDDEDCKSELSNRESYGKIVSLSIGALVGFLTGLLGLGGGYILIPTLTLLFKRGMKTAIGTSLFVIIAYAIPGAITHFKMGHVDVLVAFLLALGVVPGAYLGSKIAIGLPDRVLKQAFGVFLLIVSIYFGSYEVANLI
jgi:uncharacterized protein